MIYKLGVLQENELINRPETGMGYQVIQARQTGNYNFEKFIVLNSELVVEMNGYEGSHIKRIMSEGTFNVKLSANMITLHSITVLNETQLRNMFGEQKGKDERGAIENKVEFANGEEIFVRLSAFDNDRRIDKFNKCLKPGSFTTTTLDFLLCKVTSDNPIARYALPCNEEIKWSFHIKPHLHETLQRGVVQAANGQSGGGKEVYFEKGTNIGTLIEQLPY
ncbi:MAG: hypothetical protein ACKOW2_00400 [Sphingobacteriaceae bacterium]